MTMDGLSVRLKHTNFRRARRAAVFTIAVLVGIFLGFGLTGIRVNTSPSLPLGLYVSTDDAGAMLVEFCPAEPAATLAIERGYRLEGTCPDGATPLLKPIVAAEGDTVQVTANGIAVNGNLLPNTRPRAADTSGRPMPRVPNGIYRVERGTVWVASSYNLRSFDSRYFGAIRISTIRAHLRPLITE